jgi:hypothetical protein
MSALEVPASDRSEPQPEGIRSNFLVRFWETMDPEERKTLQDLAELDRIHGDEPTPQK